MRVRDRLLLCATAAAVLVAAAAHVHADALIAVPALLLLLPLAAGRYVGAERPRAPRARDPVPPARRGTRAGRPPRAGPAGVPRGGLLIALASRAGALPRAPPPAERAAADARPPAPSRRLGPQ